MQSGAFPGDYDVGLLITIYAIVILGGLGSIGGVVIGALVVNGAPELLRSSSNARFLFYGVLLLALIIAMRPWFRPVIVLLGTIAFGAVVHAITSAAWPRGTAGHVEGGGAFGRMLDHWVLIPTHVSRVAGWAYFVLILAALVLTLLAMKVFVAYGLAVIDGSMPLALVTYLFARSEWIGRAWACSP